MAEKWISAEIGRNWLERAEIGRNLIWGGMGGITIPIYTTVWDIPAGTERNP